MSGTSAVEFALLSPLFILLLLGMVVDGIYFGAANSIQQIAADAARTAIAGMNQTGRQTLVDSFVTNNAGGYPFVDASKLTYQANDSTADGSQFVVSIQYDARNLPIWNLGTVKPAVVGVLSGVTAPVDDLLYNVLSALGDGVGQAEMRITGATCGRSVLVQ